MNCFTQVIGLPEELLSSLRRMEFNTPTPIQAQAIPLALAGRDILGSAQTGTGKTGAFSIPLVSKVLDDQMHSAVVLTPTRELAVQVLATIHQLLGKQSHINTALLIGGESMIHQLRQLKKKPRIIVGTPGRMFDHLDRGSLKIDRAGMLVLDEMDRMLDMGFGKQIDRIVDYLPEQLQTLMFSATMPKNIMTVASKYLTDPERVEIGSSLKPLEAITQETVHVDDADKYERLLKELHHREESVIVFVKTKHSARRLAENLFKKRHKAQALHGNLRQSKRDKVVRMFRDNKFRILVATDVAARGLDVPHIAHVINYDLPQCPEDYIHRIGRTARAGATGAAVNFITSRETRLWKAIERFMKTGDQPEQQPRSRSSHRGSRKNTRGGSNHRRSKDGRSERRAFSGRRKDSKSGDSRRSESTGSSKRSGSLGGQKRDSGNRKRRK